MKFFFKKRSKKREKKKKTKKQTYICSSTFNKKANYCYGDIRAMYLQEEQ